MRLIVLFGPPAAGKGTQAKILAENTGYEHISTGDILREAVKSKTEYGKMIKDFMNKGELVSDKVVNGTVKGKMDSCGNTCGYIFDGFPRNLEQAKKFDRILESEKRCIDIVINIEIDKDLLLSRITGRKVCMKCSLIYNTELDKLSDCTECSCGGKLVQRRDDRVEVVPDRQPSQLKMVTTNLNISLEMKKQIEGLAQPFDITYTEAVRWAIELGIPGLQQLLREKEKLKEVQLGSTRLVNRLKNG